jgi:virginiamycin B lyase
MKRAWFPIFILVFLAACSGQALPQGQPAETPLSALTATLTPSPGVETALATETNSPSVTGEQTTTSVPGETFARIQEYPVPPGSHPHDVAPAPDGSVWYTAQATGELGRLDPSTGQTRHIPLGPGSAPHGVIVGPDGAPWITDGGLNAIVRVDPDSLAVQVFPLPKDRNNANMNTAVFDPSGILWFTGQAGVYGRLDPSSAEVTVYSAPRGAGPYGIASLPDGSVYFASLANHYIARIDPRDGSATVLEPPTQRQGARRVWGDSAGKIWVSEWNSGQVAVYNPADNSWREWRLPGERPQVYAVYVDDHDIVWLSDFNANSLTSFDPVQETFTVYPLPSANAAVRQILGRPGEIWGAESGVDKLVVIRTSRE